MKIAVLCSGGDAPGMNAGIAAVADAAGGAGCGCVGVRDGFVGLAAAQEVSLDGLQLDGLARQGGCFLGTSRLPAHLTQPELLEAALEGSRALGLDGLIVLGGNGSLSGLSQLTQSIPCIGVPATIDNDLSGSDLSIGWHTAVQNGLNAVDAIRDTADALQGRIFTVETLGGSTGHLALEVAYASRAHGVLTPEVEESEETILERVRCSLDRHGHVILVLSEGSPRVPTLASSLEAAAGIRVRRSVLGHAQRGGSPVAADRILARELCTAAVQLIVHEESGAVVWDGGKVALKDLAGASQPKPLNQEHYRSVWRKA